MPAIGYGCWKIPNEDTARLTYDAIKVGYRLIDQASTYGNELECGDGINMAIVDGLVKREDMFITSKLWNTHHGQNEVELACKKSLEDLGLDYLDLYMIHFPVPLENVPIEKKYPAGYADENGRTLKRREDVTYKETW